LGPPSESGRGDVRAGDLPRAGSARQRIEVYRYPQVPDLAISGTTERSFIVERLTRPLYERLVMESAGTD
jgi:hypothetical protein